jgi:hypothetical protein
MQLKESSLGKIKMAVSALEGLAQAESGLSAKDFKDVSREVAAQLRTAVGMEPRTGDPERA